MSYLNCQSTYRKGTLYLSTFGKVLIIVLDVWLNLECNYVTITIYGLCVAPM